MRKLALALAAAFAGASGLALEILLVDSAGLALGHGRSTALGLAAFLAAWALGAHAGGRSRRDPARDLLRAGAFAALVPWPALSLVLWAGGTATSPLLAAVCTLLAIAAAGYAQGLFLPPLARAFRAEVAWLLAANLLGAVVGAFAIADFVVGRSGRPVAAITAAVIAGAAGLLGAWSARGRAPSPDLERGPRVGASLSWTAAAWIVALATAWVASLEWIGLRLGVLWLGGMQPALRAVLVASLGSLALGAALVPRFVPRGAAGVLVTLALASIAGAWPLVAGEAIGGLGLESSAGPLAEIAVAALLVGPALFPLGGLVAVLHRSMPAESGERLGRLLLHEAWGALIGLPIVHFVLVPRLGLAGTIACLEGLGIVALLALARVFPRAAPLCALLPLGLGVIAFTRPSPARGAPPIANPAFVVRSFVEDRDFAVTVVDDGIGGERTLLTDGFRAAGTGAAYRYMRVLGHLPVLLSPAPRRVAVLALGTGTTVGAVALHPEVERIDVLELSRAVVDAAPWFVEKNRGALAEGLPGLADDADGRARVVVRLGDGRAELTRTPARYDVITMEPLLPDSPFGVYLYTREFYGRASAALVPGGLLCQWVPPHALEPSTFRAVLDAFASAFPWSSVWVSGTQVILVGGERAPTIDPARFEAAGELASALAELGLGTPADLVARYAVDGVRVRSGERPLTDADPWIVYRPRRTGAVLLGDLPANLAFLRERGSAAPEPWLSASGTGAETLARGLARLRAAREAHARAEARLRGHDDARPGAPDLAEALADARRLAPGDPEVADLEQEIAFLSEVRAGVSLLASDRARDGALMALPHLVNAATWRRERGDVHLYNAVAFERLGESGPARAALAKALEICPGIARTPEGRRARDLGLSEASWATAIRAAEDRKP